MQIKANWVNLKNRVGWHAVVGPYYLSVIPCNEVFLGKPSVYSGECRIFIPKQVDGIWAKTIWRAQYQNLDVTDLMRATEQALSKRLMEAATTLQWVDL